MLSHHCYSFNALATWNASSSGSLPLKSEGSRPLAGQSFYSDIKLRRAITQLYDPYGFGSLSCLFPACSDSGNTRSATSF